MGSIRLFIPVTIFLVSQFLSGSYAYNFSTNKMKVSSKDFELQSRRKVLTKAAFSIAGTSLVGKDLMMPLPAYALVKGVAPPPPKQKGEGRKCVNVEECQEMAEKLAAEEDAKVRALPPPDVTSKGTRYRDIELGSGNVSVINGDTVNIRYKVLKLGKRSYDGISGEGTVVFSRGYGLEDDESAPGQDTFECVVGDPNVINALSDGLVGMKVGGTRRLGILPQMGWEKPSKSCDGGPGGSGNGGELKTDYVIVPTATVVASETCFDQTKIPFPKAYAEQRRMAQRFDQSLLMEVTLVNVGR